MLLTKYIWTRDKGLCIYCGTHAQVIDHVYPESHGGKTIRANLVLACNSCNMKKKGLNQFYMTKGFKHLLDVGESLSWVDRYLATLPNVKDEGPLMRLIVKVKDPRISIARKERRELIAHQLRWLIRWDRRRKHDATLKKIKVEERQLLKLRLQLSSTIQDDPGEAS